jgi:hypothetical protein
MDSDTVCFSGSIALGSSAGLLTLSFLLGLAMALTITTHDEISVLME